LGEQHVEPVHGLGAGCDHVVAVFDQGAQRGDRLVDRDGAQPGGAQRGHCDGDRVGVVVLAAVPGGEHPDAGGEFRGHVDRIDPAGGQPGGQRRAQPAGTLDHPHGTGFAGGEPEQAAVPRGLTGLRIVASDYSPGPTAAAVHDALCGSIPITTRADSVVLLDTEPPRGQKPQIM
jgi:hypothetical protein